MAPGATSTRYQYAAFVPCASGLTESAPETTWSLIPSFGNRGPGLPKIRSSFVSLSQKRSSGLLPSGAASATSSSGPRNGCSVSTAPPSARSSGFSPSTSQAQVFRYHTVGRTWSVSASGPAFVIRTVSSRSCGSGLRVVGLDDPVAVVVEDPGVEQLELRILLAARRVLLHEPLVRERALRIVVAPAVPRVARRRIEIPPVLLGVLAVVALVPRQPEDALLQDRVAAVPERKPEAEELLDVGEPGQAVLAPAIRPRAGMVVRQVLPRGPVGAVVLAHRAPLPLAHVRAPVVPVARLAEAVLEPAEGRDALLLGSRARHRSSPASSSHGSCQAGKPATRRSASAGPQVPGA